MIQRLDEEFLEDVAGPRRSRRRSVVEAEEGTPADLADGPISIAVAAGIWAASDGDRVVAGDASDLVALAEQLRGRPLIAHDVKSLGGGGRAGLLAVAPPGEPGPEARHDGRRLPDRPGAPHLRPQRAGGGRRPRGGSGGSGRQASCRLPPRRARRRATRPTDARLVIELAARQREPPRRVRARAAPERRGDAADRGAGRDGARRRQARRRAPGRDRGGDGRAESPSSRAEIFELAGHEFTIGSPQQLGEVLFDELGLTKKRRGKTGFSTDARVLAQIRDEHEIVAKVETWRELTKLKNTYLDALPELIDPETGRIHTTFNQVATDHGAPLERQPEPPEHPDSLRDRQAGPRLLRGGARDAPAVGRLQPGRASSARPCGRRGRAARDLRLRRGRPRHHRGRGARAFRPRRSARRERSKAKMVNYGIAYGLSAFGLADRLQISREEAAVVHPALLRALPGRASASSTRRSPRPSATASSTRFSAGGGRSPSCAPISVSGARWASGWPSTP